MRMEVDGVCVFSSICIVLYGLQSGKNDLTSQCVYCTHSTAVCALQISHPIVTALIAACLYHRAMSSVLTHSSVSVCMHMHTVCMHACHGVCGVALGKRRHSHTLKKHKGNTFTLLNKSGWLRARVPQQKRKKKSNTICLMLGWKKFRDS